MSRLSGNFENDILEIDSVLRTAESFDLSKRVIVTKSGQRCAFFYVGGLTSTQAVQDFIRYCLEAEEIRLGSENVPYKEAMPSSETEVIITKILSGLTCMLIEGKSEAILIDMRTIPLRSVEEPENDKVLRGARDGFGEALQPNAALIRRRIRSPELTFSVVTVGTLTKSDVCICYMRNKADLKFVENVKKQISAIEIESLNFQCQTISEALIKKKWPRFGT